MAASRNAWRSPRLLPRARKAVTDSAISPFQVFAGNGEDVAMIEGKPRRPGQREPAHLGRIIPRARLQFAAIHHGQIDNADRSATRIALRITEGMKLDQFPRCTRFPPAIPAAPPLPAIHPFRRTRPATPSSPRTARSCGEPAARAASAHPSAPRHPPSPPAADIRRHILFSALKDPIGARSASTQRKQVLLRGTCLRCVLRPCHTAHARRSQ